MNTDGSVAGRSQRIFVKFSDRTSGLDCDGSTISTSSATRNQPTGCSYATAAPVTIEAQCPVSPETREVFNPATSMPQSLSEVGTSVGVSDLGLNPQRQASSIPMAPIDVIPKHQKEGQQVWMYPSEQMFFSAMKRKGWDPRKEDMQAVVSIHNSVNERAWREVMAWEALHANECAMPRLKKFVGRPSDYSPKARILNTLGYALPFDRHDWVVDRCGKEVRYVIDFYNGAPQGSGAPVAMFLDVRPALDSLEAVWDRLTLQMIWMWSGRWQQ